MVLSNRDIVLASTTDAKDILAISSECFGSNYLNKEQLATYLNSTDSHVFVFRLANQTAGFVVCRLMNGVHIPLNYKKIDNQFDKKEVLIIQTIAFKNEFVGKGYGGELLSFILTEPSFKFDHVLSINWKINQHIPLKSACEKLGLKEWIEIKNYWKEDSLKRHYVCIECGKPPCTCSAVLFRKSPS